MLTAIAASRARTSLTSWHLCYGADRLEPSATHHTRLHSPAVERCLERDPHKRLVHGDARLEIDEPNTAPDQPLTGPGAARVLLFHLWPAAVAVVVTAFVGNGVADFTGV